MALDGVLLNSVLVEFKEEIIGGRIDRIHQPEKDEIYMVVRAQNKNKRILISASSNYPRIHLTEINKSNPMTPPLFCMVLRKHLLGARIIGIEQPDFERIMILYIEAKDELGDLSTKKLVIEIMGRHSNIILIDNDEAIIDSIKRVPKEISRVRQVLPGLDFIFPPSQGKQNPLLQDEDTFKSIIGNPSSSKQAARLIMNNFTGISRVTSQEIAHRAALIDLDMSQNGLGISHKNLEPKNAYIHKLALAFNEFFKGVKASTFKPIILKDDTGRPVDIFPFQYTKYPMGLQKSFDSPSDALEAFFELRDRIDRVRQRSTHLLRVLNTNLERCQKKHSILLQEYKQAQNAHEYRLYGELITANIYQISKGMDKVELANYYDPDSKLIEIPLDPGKAPSENAQRYFKKYNRAKKALTMTTKQLKETKREMDYLESQLNNLDKSTEEAEIDEIRQELVEEGYIKPRTGKKKAKKLPPSKPHHFLSSHDFDIYVGKNNAQNDRLTLRTAEPEDIWLHTKDIAGSHVIIKKGGREVPAQTLLEAGMLAAYFSKAQRSSKVPVDYCPRKNVRKPNGAKPGMVIYDNHSTIFVTPKESEINKLKRIN